MSEVILQTYFRHPQICGRCAAVAKDAFKKMAIFQIDRVQSLRCAFSVMTVGFGRIFCPDNLTRDKISRGLQLTANSAQPARDLQLIAIEIANHNSLIVPVMSQSSGNL